jgi:hypothetical protein
MNAFLAQWQREIETARARVAALVEREEAASELEARWVLTEEAVVWWIDVGAAREPDVDLEDVGGAIVVRVRREGAPPLARVVLPLPSSLPIAAIAVEFRERGLEVRLLLEPR